MPNNVIVLQAVSCSKERISKMHRAVASRYKTGLKDAFAG